MAMATAGTLPY